MFFLVFNFVCHSISVLSSSFQCFCSVNFFFWYVIVFLCGSSNTRVRRSLERNEQAWSKKDQRADRGKGMEPSILHLLKVKRSFAQYSVFQCVSFWALPKLHDALNIEQMNEKKNQIIFSCSFYTLEMKFEEIFWKEKRNEIFCVGSKNLSVLKNSEDELNVFNL